MNIPPQYRKHLPLAAVTCALALVLYAALSRTPPGRVDLSSQSSYAEQAVAAAEYAARNRESRRPRMPVSPDAEVLSEGSIMIVRDRNFEGAAEKPKGMEQMLREMAQAKQPAAVSLNDAQLDNMRIKPGGGPYEGAVRSSAVPLPGGEMQEGGLGMISAPVDYKLFRNKAAWNAFRGAHKGDFPESDFSGNFPLILVSVSELPSCIFKITGVAPTRAAVNVYYRLDPLAMAADGSGKDYEVFSSTLVPAGFDVKLVQVP
ncbi:MAG: hypothetical protein FD189_2329 [Elusimicrobia bacterium]|nr:MAG: hypothetical protein FD154_2323 [Elusimicrobiota bacterium]KAF0153710.1 MAG: hypothetical protein FD189_2329 [Elusimicrobiota bacterium]